MSKKMNKIKGSTIHDKIRELIPNIPSIISPEALDKLCEDDSVQTFLKWFNDNVNSNNILTDECIELKKHIQNKGKWLQGMKLDMALAEETADCPELLKLIESDYWNSNQAHQDNDVQKELYDQDLEYLQSIENSISKLKKCKDQLNSDLEKEDDNLKKEEIKVKLIYDNCLSILQDFDTYHRQFSEAVELLASTYVNALQKKDETCLWTQMPIELYIKQLETYNDYLSAYAKRQFSPSERTDEKSDSDSSGLFNETSNNKKILECKENLFESKMNEIIAKIEESVSIGLVNHAREIFNEGNLRAPGTPVMVRADLAELTKGRDYLEENVNILQEKRLMDMIQQFSQTKIVKVLEREAETRLQRRKEKLLKLKRLCTFAEEHGHAFATLICMLFELQIHKINEILQFVLDARHYVSKEYSLSLLRNESMQGLQKEYSSIMDSPRDQNLFSKALIDMAGLTGLDSKDNFQAAVQHYDDLKDDNSHKLRVLFDEKLVEMMDKLENLETRVMKLYQEETSQSPTLTFTEVPCHILDQIDKTMKHVQELENNTETMKIKLKNMIKESSNPSFEREKLLLWQKFLADPESLRERCEELEDAGDRPVF